MNIYFYLINLLINFIIIECYYNKFRYSKFNSKKIELYNDNIDTTLDNTNDDVSQQTKLIQSLIDKATNTAKAAKLINMTVSSNTTYELTKIKFASKYKNTINLKNETNAIRYLNLPIESYSVLDSGYISRSKTNNNTFIINIPLNNIQAGLDSSTSMGVKLPNYASINIDVKPVPLLGYIEMKSGDIIFIYNKTKDGTEVIDYDYDENAKVYTASKSKDSPPKWLVWGADSSGYVDNGQSISVKSSIQSKVTIQLSWVAKQKDFSPQDFFQRVLNPLKSKPKEINPPLNETILPLRIDVLVAIDMNIPVKAAYARILNFTPIRLIIQQVGSLIGDSMLRIIGLSLIGKLVENYNLRQQQWYGNITVDNSFSTLTLPAGK